MSVEVLERYSQLPEAYDPVALHPNPRQLIFDSLKQGTILAGREKPLTWEMDEFTSEGSLHRYRAQVEVEHVINLAENGPNELRVAISEQEKVALRLLYSKDIFDPEVVAKIEHFGYDDKPANEHDVRAVEKYVGMLMDNAGLGHLKHLLHFGMTSEDTNNIAYNMMLRDATNSVTVPAVERMADRLAFLAAEYAEGPILGITHAQNAAPTTIGKQMGYLLSTITKVLGKIEGKQLSGKFSGAVGNHGPMKILFPEFDYDQFARQFVESFGFDYSPIQNQRNDHIEVVSLLSTVSELAVVGKNAADNVWLGILGGTIVQELVEGEDGSSTMTQKINPWRLEVAEALFEQAISLNSGAAEGLIASRHERDISDHAWQRAYGDIIGRVTAAYNYFTIQLDRLVIDKDGARTKVNNAVEVLGELVQTAGRTLGDPNAYDKVKALTQGKKLDAAAMHKAIDIVLPESDIKRRVKGVVPAGFIGDAAREARQSVLYWDALRRSVDKGVLDWRFGIDGVLFDLDDTIIMGDKQELAARVGAVALELDADINDTDMAVVLKTNGWTATIEAFIRAHNTKHPDQLITIEQFNKSHQGITGSFDHLLTLAPDTELLLDNLDRKNMKKAIVTSRGPNSLPRVLALHNLTHRFDATVHGTEVSPGKPHPAPVATALRKLGIVGRRAMMVGDHQLNDIVPAKALDLKTVLVLDGLRDPDGAVPTMQVRNLRELAMKFER